MKLSREFNDEKQARARERALQAMGYRAWLNSQKAMQPGSYIGLNNSTDMKGNSGYGCRFAGALALRYWSSMNPRLIPIATFVCPVIDSPLSLGCA